MFTSLCNITIACNVATIENINERPTMKFFFFNVILMQKTCKSYVINSLNYSYIWNIRKSKINHS